MPQLSFRSWTITLQLNECICTAIDFKFGKEDNMRILLIEDDNAVSTSIKQMLFHERCEVTTADIGEVGLSLGRRNEYDIIVLDLQLPDMTGIDILRAFRSENVHTPVLVLSGNANPEVKTLALKSGADDYLTKPFHREEFLARIRAVVRRARSHSHSLLTIGKIVLDLNAKTVSVGGVPIDLTTKEYEILKMLSQRKGVTLSKEVILNQLYGGVDVPNDKIIDVFVCKLRKKLGSDIDANAYVKTIWGCGYQMHDPSEI